MTMGMETSRENHSTMDTMPNFLARFENFAAFPGSVASSACRIEHKTLKYVEHISSAREERL